MAQMEGNYYFADNLLEKTVGIHMLLSLRFKCPKLDFFFSSIISSIFSLNTSIVKDLFLLSLDMGMLLASESHVTRQMWSVNQFSR